MRKTAAILGFLIVFIAILAGAALWAQAQEPARKVIVTLDPGETIMNGESMLVLNAEADKVVLVTTKGKGSQGPFSVFRGGAKKGPFNNLKDAMMAAYGSQNMPPEKNRDCAEYKPAPAPEGAQPTIAEGKGGQTLQFKGMTLGPHRMILSNRVTPDGALAYITASDNDKAWLECSDGRKVSFGGIPGEFKFSPDGKNAAALVQGHYSLNEINNLTKLPPEKLADAYKDMDKNYLYTIDGKKFGPFDPSAFGSYWYPKTCNDLYFRVQDEVFRNGAPMLKASSFDSCNFYTSPDGKSYAMFNYSNIIFSDGKKYPAPLDVLAYQDKGRTIIKWLTLENNKDLVVYQRAI